MSYDFKSSRSLDAAIFAGYQPNLNELFSRQYFRIQEHSDLYKQAFSLYESSFNEHQKELLNKYSFENYTEEVNAHTKEFMSEKTSKDIRIKVASKLQELAHSKMVEIQSFNPVHLLFHKLGQFLVGHGYQTKAEWAHSLADRVENAPQIMIQDYVKNHFNGDWNMGDSMPLDKEHYAIINDMQPDAFLKAFISYRNSSQSVYDRKWRTFYLGLNPEKKRALLQYILADREWPLQLMKLVYAENNYNGWDAILNDEIKNQIKSQTAVLFDFMKKNAMNGHLTNDSWLLVELVVKDYLKNNDLVGLSQFMKNSNHRQFITFLSLNRKLITEEEMESIRSNFR